MAFAGMIVGKVRSIMHQRKWSTAAFAACGAVLSFFLATHSLQGASTTPWSRWTRIRMQARPMFLFFGEVNMNVRQEGGKKLIETQTRATLMGAELARSRTLTTIDSTSGK